LISSYLEQLIEFFEKDRFTPLTAFIFMVVIGTVRSVAESLIYEYPVFSTYLVIQHIAFNFPVLIMGALVLSIAADTPLWKTYNAILPGFAIVMVPPFVDYFIFGYAGAEHSGIYAYFAADVPFYQKIVDLYPPIMLFSEDISVGLRRMALSIITLSGLYVAVKVRIWESIKLISEKKFKPVLKKVGAIFFGAYGVWVVAWFISSLVPTSISLQEGNVVVLDFFKFPPYTKYYVFIQEYGYGMSEILSNGGGLATNMALQQRSLYLTMFFFIISTGFVFLSMRLRYRSVLKKILSTLKITYILPTFVSALLGSAVLHLLDPDFSKGWAIDPTYVLHFPYIFYIAAMGLLLGCFGCFISDYYKEEKILPKSYSRNMAIISLLAGGSFAFLMGPIRITLIFLLATGLIYLSFRKREETSKIYPGVVYSVACSVIYFIGVMTPAFWKTREYDTYTGEFSTLDLSRSPGITSEVIGLMLILFFLILIVNVLAHLLKEGKISEWLDSSGLNLPLILLGIAFLPAIMFHEIHHLIVFGTLGVASVLLTDEDLSFVPMGIASLSLFYVVLSLWGIAPGV